MLDFMFKQLLSLAISIATVHVPQDKWQKRLDSLPAPSERIAKKKHLKGWRFHSVTSPATGLTHTCYLYPSTDSASRRVLLLLHGFNTDGSIFFNLTPLADTRTLIAYNFPEKTDVFTGSIRDFEIIIDDFCAAAHLDTVELLGNSLGGIIATFYAAHTEKVTIRNLVLASTYVHGSTKENIRRIRGMADKLLPYPDYKLFYLLSLGSRLSNRFEKRNNKKDSPLETVVIKQIDWYREILKALYWYEGADDARKLACPVLVLHGKNDRLVPSDETEAIHEYIPHARIKVFDKAGHLLIFSQARECIGEIRKFEEERENVASRK